MHLYDNAYINGSFIIRTTTDPMKITFRNVKETFTECFCEEMNTWYLHSCANVLLLVSAI